MLNLRLMDFTVYKHCLKETEKKHKKILNPHIMQLKYWGAMGSDAYHLIWNIPKNKVMWQMEKEGQTG